MNQISSIIATLSAADKKKFISDLKHRNKRNDTKNIALFRLMDTSDPVEDPDFLLYGKRAKGAYHALCKRLHESLIDFVASKYIDGESSKESDVLKLVLASRTFFEHQQYAIAFKTIARAERTAIKYSLYNILNDIYNIQLSHAHLNNSIDFEETLKKYQRNRLNIQQEENLNLFYAAIQNELTGKNPSISDILDRNLALYNISITKNLSYQSLFKLLQISNQVANISRNYYEILEFIEEARQKIETSERVQHEHLYYHIQILYYLANTYFRIRKFKRSAAALRSMHHYMLLKDQKYLPVFYCQQLLITSLLEIYTGKLDSVIEKLSHFDFKKYKNEQVYVHDLKLTRIVALFLAENFKNALQLYRDFYHSDNWYAKKIGFIWVIKKNLLEILLLMELDYMDLVESRLRSFRKKYRDHLLEHKEERILQFVRLAEVYYNNNSIVHSQEFITKLDEVLHLDKKDEDIFALSFYAWLRSKIESKKTYDTCLSLIGEE